MVSCMQAYQFDSMNQITKLIYTLLLPVVLLASCSPTATEQTRLPANGLWRGSLQLPNVEVPFLFEIRQLTPDSMQMLIYNAEERLLLDNLHWDGDSLVMPMHIFDADIRAKVQGATMKGIYRKYDTEDEYSIPFTAVHGDTARFKHSNQPTQFNLNGRWEVEFTEDGKTKPAIGDFKQQGNRLTGTFITPTGDQRYLEGAVEGNKLMLSAFDGSRIYLFTAQATDANTLTNGEFTSGLVAYSTWQAKRNPDVTLPDAYGLTSLNNKNKPFAFTFPDMEGRPVSLSDEKFKGKVVVVQVFGTWCPNCMDEVAFLVPWYEQNKSRGVEIIALSFEKKPDLDYARSRIEKVQKRYKPGYEFLFAGSMDPEHRNQALPQLSGILAFPTTIFIGKNGRVHKIHTGFSGPGTGTFYDEFVKEFNATINELLQE
jgi:thiol-disulfide isomerase/thioredoxin